MTSCLVGPTIEYTTAPDVADAPDVSGVSDVDVMDSVEDLDVEPRLQRGLRGYLGAVARELGVGLESCTLDVDLPASAYLAVDHRLPEFSDRDLALLWDEVHGWAAAIETHSGEDLIIVSYLDTDTVTPAVGLVARFLHELTGGHRAGVRSGRRRLGRPDPAVLRTAGDHESLVRALESAAHRTSV